jgi:hypothetical protein
VIDVPPGNVLPLKSAVTALPDGTFLLAPQLVPAGLFPAAGPVAEDGDCHVAPLGAGRVAKRSVISSWQTHPQVDHPARRVVHLSDGQAEPVPEKAEPLPAGPGDQLFGGGALP